MKRRTLIYKTDSGAEPFNEYIESLRDRRAVSKIMARVNRAKLGNLGDYRSVGAGVIELRIPFGPGYRVYAGLQGEDLIVLLCAGDKSSQDNDVSNAINYWEDL